MRIVEARDRIGGRTWLDRRLGTDIELGGTWVHWIQPFVWAELHRYGLGLVPSPVPERAWRRDGHAAVAVSPDALLDLLDEPNRMLGAEARDVFPQPFAPLTSERALAIDEVRLAERLAELPTDAARAALTRAFWTLNFNGRLDDAAYTQALRWLGLAGGDWRLMFEACATYKIAGGTRALAEAMLADITGELTLGTEVAAISEDAGTVTVLLDDGESVTADAVVVTAPLHALGRIRFSPELDTAGTAAIESGQLGLGTKIWVAVEGRCRTSWRSATPTERSRSCSRSTTSTGARS